MIEGRCPRCGRIYLGWALLSERYQSCADCGIGLDIRTEDGKILKGYSPFTAEEYRINQKKTPRVSKKE
jgi:hypothetical protein